MHNTECEVEVEITDVNDQTPQFALEMYVATVPENEEIGTELLRVTATDGDTDINGLVHYKILSGDPNGRFDLEETTGNFLFILFRFAVLLMHTTTSFGTLERRL